MKALGPWRCDRTDRLGGGGYAQVFRGWHPDDPGTIRAIKVLNDPTYVATLQREVSTLQTLAGAPGVAQLLDFGRAADGSLCLVTELAPGIRLDQQIRRDGPMSLASARALARQLLAVLRVAHERGLLHKDITPGNILLDAGRATLIDWGVSAPLGDGRAESVHAKLDYCAPELFDARHHRASDFYSLAWVLIFALTGARPYHFDTDKERGYRVVAHVLERPRVPQSIDPALRALLLNWLSKRPEARVLGYDLDALLRDPPASRIDLLRTREYRQLRYEFSYWHLAARHGIVYAQYQYAEQLLALGREAEAIYWLTMAHEQGYSPATRRLAKRRATPPQS
jgi:serine/threonine protein kinase